MSRGKSKRRLEMGEEAWVEYQCELRDSKVERYRKKHPPIEWRRRTKLKLIEYKGGKCQICGWDQVQYPRHFVFHHRDPSTKDFQIGGKTLKWETLRKEVDKCDLLCGRCHDILHEEEYLQERERSRQESFVECRNCGKDFIPERGRQRYCSPSCRLKQIRPKSRHQLPRSRCGSRTCPHCGKSFSCFPSNIRVFCSAKCYHFHKRVVKRPSTKKLAAMISTMSWVAIGRKYDVSDNAVRKWARSYGIID